MLSAYPLADDHRFTECHGGVVTCWTTARDVNDGVDLARSDLLADGWMVCRLEEAVALVDPQPSEADAFARAQERGVHCSVAMLRRLVVERSREVFEGPPLEDLPERFAASCGRVLRQNGVFIAKRDDACVAVRILEEEALVLWSSLEDAARWGPDDDDDAVVTLVSLASSTRCSPSWTPLTSSSPWARPIDW